MLEALAVWKSAVPDTRPSVTIGGAVRDRSVNNSYDLQKHADLALYAAKVSGKDRFTLYEPDARELAKASA